MVAGSRRVVAKPLTFCRSLVLPYPKDVTESYVYAAIPSRSVHDIRLCRSYGTQQTGEGVPTGSSPGRMVPIGDHHRSLQYHVSLKCIGSHEFLPSHIGPTGRTGTYTDLSFTFLLSLFFVSLSTHHCVEAKGSLDHGVISTCPFSAHTPRYY
jgi:hypothetical protein